MAITENILFDLFRKKGLDFPSILYVLNKIDRQDSYFSVHSFPKEKPHVCISAKTGLGRDELITAIENALASIKREHHFFFPHSDASKLSFLYQNAKVSQVRYEADGVYADAICDEKTMGQLAHYIIQE